MRIVVDTNCIIQSIGFRSNYRVVWDAFLAGKYTMCVSNEILDEYYEILQRLFRPAFAETVINAISGVPGKVPYVINTDKCIKCGTCMSNCRFGAISRG